MSFQTSLLSLLLAIFTEEFAIRGTHSVYVAIAGEVVKSRSVHLINFCSGGQVIALKSATALILYRWASF